MFIADPRLTSFTLLQNRKTKLWLSQFDKTSGNLQWEYSYIDPQCDVIYPSDLFKTKEDQYYITGNVQSIDYSLSTGYMLKVDQQGQHVWDYTFPATALYNQGDRIIIDPSGEIYVFGGLKRTRSEPNAFYIVKWKEF